MPYMPLEELCADAVAVPASGLPVTGVLVASWQPDRPEAVRTLEPADTLEALMANTLNLWRSGGEGLATLCDLATSVPVTAITHHDAVALAARLVGQDRV